MLYKKIETKYKEHKFVILVMTFFSLLLYSFFMTQQLTNNCDGFWQQDYYLAGGWEISCGRWLWPYLDKFLFGIHIDPLTTIGSLAFFVIGYILILDMFKIKNKKVAVLGGLLFISSPVILVILSYRYMSLTFATSFLLAVFASYFCVKVNSRVVSVVLSMLFVSFSMSFYQAHLAVIGVLGLAFIIYLCIHNISFDKIFEFFVKMAISIIGGGLLYYLLLNIYLKITGTDLGGYMGVSDVSVISILKNLPNGIGKAYQSFFAFFFKRLFKYNVFDGKRFLLVFGIFFGIMMLSIILYVFRKNTYKAVIVLLSLGLMPLAATATLLLAEDAQLLPHMSCSLIIVLVITLILSGCVWEKRDMTLVKPLPGKIAGILVTVLLTFFIYGNSVQNLLDQNAMNEGKIATVTMFTQIIDDLKEAGVASGEHELFFIGKPYSNKSFKVSPLFEQANSYAKVGDLTSSGDGMYLFYNALLNKLMHVNLPVAYENYENKAYDEYYQSMPCYPEEGYFVVWDQAIIKISEP